MLSPPNSIILIQKLAKNNKTEGNTVQLVNL
jgi:hypothetical protein